jgi:hypothetical protein
MQYLKIECLPNLGGYKVQNPWHRWIKKALSDQIEERMSDRLLVGLRPLRRLNLCKADEEIKSLLYGYDIRVVIPKPMLRPRSNSLN